MKPIVFTNAALKVRGSHYAQVSGNCTINRGAWRFELDTGISTLGPGAGQAFEFLLDGVVHFKNAYMVDYTHHFPSMFTLVGTLKQVWFHEAVLRYQINGNLHSRKLSEGYYTRTAPYGLKLFVTEDFGSDIFTDATLEMCGESVKLGTCIVEPDDIFNTISPLRVSQYNDGLLIRVLSCGNWQLIPSKNHKAITFLATDLKEALKDCAQKHLLTGNEECKALKGLLAYAKTDASEPVTFDIAIGNCDCAVKCSDGKWVIEDKQTSLKGIGNSLYEAIDDLSAGLHAHWQHCKARIQEAESEAEKARQQALSFNAVWKRNTDLT
jgi:hypothetical protein